MPKQASCPLAPSAGLRFTQVIFGVILGISAVSSALDNDGILAVALGTVALGVLATAASGRCPLSSRARHQQQVEAPALSPYPDASALIELLPAEKRNVEQRKKR